jgi:hypothetical protein
MVAGIRATLESARADLKLIVDGLASGQTTTTAPTAADVKRPDAPKVQPKLNISKLTTSAVSNIASSMRGASDAASRSYTAMAQAFGITKFAKGGIVTGPTNALIGEAGPEAVIPLSGANSASLGATYNIVVNAGIGTSGSQVGREIVDAIKKFEKTSGPVFASA